MPGRVDASQPRVYELEAAIEAGDLSWRQRRVLPFEVATGRSRLRDGDVVVEGRVPDGPVDPTAEKLRELLRRSVGFALIGCRNGAPDRERNLVRRLHARRLIASFACALVPVANAASVPGSAMSISMIETPPPRLLPDG
jgi:hypothetical protein